MVMGCPAVRCEYAAVHDLLVKACVAPVSLSNDELIKLYIHLQQLALKPIVSEDDYISDMHLRAAMLPVVDEQFEERGLDYPSVPMPE